MQPPTLKNVAAAAGVHVSTVSRALKGDPSIPKTTSDRIAALAKSMGYRPNPLTSALMEARRRGAPARFRASIAFLIYNARKDAYHKRSWIYRVFEGAKVSADSLGYAIELFWLGDRELADSKQLDRVLTTRGVQGLILPSEHEATRQFDIDWEKFSVLSLHFGHSASTPRFNQLVSNHFRSIVEACERCIDRGYKRVGLVLRDHPRRQIDYGRMILGGYLAATNSLDPKSRLPPLMIPELDAEKIADWYHREKPDAIVFAGGGFSVNYSQQEVVKDLQQLGVPLIDKIGMVVLCQLPNEGFAGIDERSHVIGQNAVELLADLVMRNQKGVPDEPLTHFVDGSWVDGESLPNKK